MLISGHVFVGEGRVLFLGFCCPLWFLGEHDSCGLSTKECSCGTAMCGLWGSGEECVSRHWELILRNQERLNAWRTEKDHKWKTICMCPENLCRPLAMGAREEGKAAAATKLGIISQEMELEDRNEREDSLLDSLVGVTGRTPGTS